MVTSGGGEQEIEFRAKFNIDVAALQAQLKQTKWHLKFRQ